jgi:Ulp1 family protease
VFVNHVFLFDAHIQRVVFPCNLNRTHWYACVMDFEHRAVFVHDPLGHQPADFDNLVTDIKYFMQVHARSCVEDFHRQHVESIIRDIPQWRFLCAPPTTPKQVLVRQFMHAACKLVCNTERGMCV